MAAPAAARRRPGVGEDAAAIAPSWFATVLATSSGTNRQSHHP